MTEFETKDSGKHEKFGSGMKRDTRDGKPRFALMWTELQPYEQQMVTRYAKLLARGAAKYEDRNWEKGDSKVELEDSLLRHTAQLVAGETDEDHAAAVWFNTQAIEYFRWRIAEKAKKPKMTLDFNFDADSTGKHILEILTGNRSGMFIRGNVVPTDPLRPLKDKRNDLVGKAFDEAFPPNDVAAMWNGKPFPPAQPDLEQAPVIAAFDGSNSDDGFILARQQHQASLNDWHNRETTEPTAPTVAVTEAVNELNKTVAEVARSAAMPQNFLVGEPIKKRPDEWLKHYGIELQGGDLGDTYLAITDAEFCKRIVECKWSRSAKESTLDQGNHGE